MDCLKEEKRELLRKEFGRVFKGEEIIKHIKKENLVSVGDYSTLLFLKNKIIPKISIVDMKNKRKEINEDDKRTILNTYKRKIFFKNKRGCVSETAKWLSKIKKDLDYFLLVVEGEEDMVALPFILNIENETVVYGLWDKGGVVVKSNKKLKEVYEELFQ